MSLTIDQNENELQDAYEIAIGKQVELENKIEELTKEIDVLKGVNEELLKEIKDITKG